jgi:hypothetical protein
MGDKMIWYVYVYVWNFRIFLVHGNRALLDKIKSLCKFPLINNMFLFKLDLMYKQFINKWDRVIAYLTSYTRLNVNSVPAIDDTSTNGNFLFICGVINTVPRFLASRLLYAGNGLVTRRKHNIKASVNSVKRSRNNRKYRLIVNSFKYRAVPQLLVSRNSSFRPFRNYP